jgi:hypothetical protein
MTLELDPTSTELFGGGHVVHLATLRGEGGPDAYIGKPFPMRSGHVFVVEADAQGAAELPFEDKR